MNRWCAWAVAALLVGATRAQIDTEPLVGTVVDPDGKPIAGARVEAWRRDGRGFVGLDLEYRAEATRLSAVPTDKHGRFAMQVPVGHLYELRVDHAPYARWCREQSVASPDQRIQLEPGATFRGKLIADGGNPTPGRLRAWSVDSGATVFDARSDTNGGFSFDRLPSGKVRVEVLPDGCPSPSWLEVTLAWGNAVEQDVQLSPGTLLQGRVVDTKTKQPIAGATIGEGWTLRRKAATNADGRYELRGYGSPGARDIYCQAPGFVEQIVRKPASGTDPWILDFELERGLEAAGRIVDPAGKPVAGVYVRVFGTHHDGQDQVHDCVAMRTAADGTFRLGGLRSTLDHVLVVRADGWATAVYALPQADASHVKQAGEVRLGKPNLVRGVVLDADGKVLPHAKVMIWGYNGDRQRLAPGGNLGQMRIAQSSHAPNSWGILDMYVAGHETSTNAAGQFAFASLPEGTFRLITYAENNRRIFVGDAFQVPAGATQPFELNAQR